jgi:hypothetical protein
MRALVIGVFVAVLSPGSLGAQVVPPPIIVPQVTPQFNNPGPQLVVPQPGNPVQQLYPSLGGGSQVDPVYIIPERSIVEDRRHPTTKHRHVSRTRISRKQHSQGTSSREAPPKDMDRPPITSSASQQPEETHSQQPKQTPTDKTLKELDAALAKKLKSICRGC